MSPTDMTEAAVVTRCEWGWLLVHEVLEWPANRADVPESKTLLVWNATLPGAVKFVFTPDRRIALRAELRSDDPEAFKTIPPETEAGLDTARRLWAAPRTAVAPAAWPSAASEGKYLAEAASHLGGWCKLESNGCAVIDVDPAHRWRAVVVPRADGGALALAELVAWPSEPVSARVIGDVLLQAGARLRLACPMIRNTGEQEVAGFEVPLAPGFSSTDLEVAIGALAIAGGDWAGECQALLQPGVARDYRRAIDPFLRS